MSIAFRLPMSVLLVLVLVLGALPASEDQDVRMHGAIGDGIALDTIAIQKAIDAVAAAGGGTVRFSPGTYLSGSVSLKSHVTLEFEKGATLRGSTNRNDYRKLNFYAIILADRQEDIGIRGHGVIDGQGEILAANATGAIVKGSRPYAGEGERPVLINFKRCRNIAVRDITLRDSACWVQHYRDCTGLTLERVTVRSHAAITNDGLDIDGCSQVVVRHCDIDSGDDGICLKSGPLACDDVLIENCRVRSSCNALKFGTASTTGFRNIICRNLEIYDTYISGIALEIVDGGRMENVTISNIRITDTCNPLFICLGQREAGKKPGTISDITISDVTATIPFRDQKDMDKFPTNYLRRRRIPLVTGAIVGLPGNPVKNVTLRNVAITFGGIGATPQPGHLGLDMLAKVPECINRYPESTMFGVLPAWGLYVRHVEGLTCENVTLRVSGSDYRSALVCDDVRGLTLDGFHVESAGAAPLLVFNDVVGATIRKSVPPAGATRFLHVQGATREIVGP